MSIIPGLMMAPRMRVTVNTAATSNFTFQGSDITMDGANPTSDSISFGTATAGRYLFAQCATFDAGGDHPTSVSIGGVTATQIGTTLSINSVKLSLWRANVPSGTSGTVNWNTGGSSVSDGGVALWRIDTGTSVQSSTTDSGAKNDLSFSLTVSSGDDILAVAFGVNNGACTWTNANEDIDSDIRSSENMTGATTQATSAGTFNITASMSGATGNLGIAIAWG